MRKKAVREAPHLWGPHAARYFADTQQQEELQREIDTALEKVYGSDATREKRSPGQIWYQNYVEGPANRRLFRKWFKERYSV